VFDLRVHWLGLAGWRWLFILEGLPAIILGIISLFVLTDWPKQARWLPEDEQSWLVDQLQQELLAKRATRRYTIWQAIRDANVVLLTGRSFFTYVGSYGLSFWLPTILKKVSGISDFRISVLAALPYLVGLAVMLLNGWHSDRTLERRWHTAIPLGFAAIGFSLVAVVGARPSIVLACFMFVQAAILASLAMLRFGRCHQL
jgi:ACS family tartrate transporter-like MFS transporter